MTLMILWDNYFSILLYGLDYIPGTTLLGANDSKQFFIKFTLFVQLETRVN